MNAGEGPGVGRNSLQTRKNEGLGQPGGATWASLIRSGAWGRVCMALTHSLLTDDGGGA